MLGAAGLQGRASCLSGTHSLIVFQRINTYQKLSQIFLIFSWIFIINCNEIFNRPPTHSLQGAPFGRLQTWNTSGRRHKQSSVNGRDVCSKHRALPSLRTASTDICITTYYYIRWLFCIFWFELWAAYIYYLFSEKVSEKVLSLNLLGAQYKL